MCPACIASATVMATGAMSGSGILGILAFRFRKIVNFCKPGPIARIKEKQS